MTPGKVYLVGGGPGDPGLISVRGVECLKLADEVLYDGLVNPLLLRHTHAHCERTCRSDGPDGRILKQDDINQRLVDAAMAGKTVVRLKGGDPFIFGRGSEEAACLRKHGIEYEIVPGITAATAAGEYAGFSLTHRESASMVTFVTGHEAPDKSGSALDYSQLAASPGTLVFYMGLHHLPQISQSLLDHGKSPDTPTAVISRATTPFQRTIVAPLKEIASAVAEAKLHAPSLIIVGDCVRQREELAWFEERPLFGQKIGITRPADQAEPQIKRAFELGAQPVLMPAIEITPIDDWAEVDATLERLSEFDWLIFTSVNGVHALLDRLWNTGGDARQLAGLRIATIGTSTAQALAEYHLQVDLVPDEFRAEALAKASESHLLLGPSGVDSQRLDRAGSPCQRPEGSLGARQSWSRSTSSRTAEVRCNGRRTGRLPEPGRNGVFGRSARRHRRRRTQLDRLEQSVDRSPHRRAVTGNGTRPAGSNAANRQHQPRDDRSSERRRPARSRRSNDLHVGRHLWSNHVQR